MTHEIKARAGGIVVDEDQNIHIVRPHGFVSRSTLQKALSEASSFAAAHPEGWWYVTDASRPVFPDPLNAIRLRRITRLPNIRGYLLVAPSPLIRPVMKVWARIIGANAVVESMDAARGWIAARD